MRSDGDGQEAAPLWSFVPLAEAAPPPEPASETVRRGWRGLLGRLLAGRRPSQDPQARAHGEPWSEHEREQWLPPVDREAQLAALEATLGDGARELVVGPPNGGLGKLVAAIGQRRGWQVLPPPGPEALLNDPGAATAALANLDGRPAVLTGLEGMFVRTPAGLRAARELTALLLARRAPTIAACSSWAWRFLSIAVDGRAVFTDPWALQPLDGERLGRWLQTAPGIMARESAEVWALAPADAAPHADRASFLARVAAAARGDPRVARAIWANALRRPGGDGDHVRTGSATLGRCLAGPAPAGDRRAVPRRADAAAAGAAP